MSARIRPWRSPALLGTFAVLRLMPRVSRTMTVWLAIEVFVSTALPLAFTVVSGLLVGSVPAAVRSGLDAPAGRHALTLLGLAAALIAVQRIIAPFDAALAASFGRKVDRHLQERVMLAVSRPVGIEMLEDPAVRDLVASAQGVGASGVRPGTAVASLASLLPSWLGALGSAAILIRFNPLVGLIWIVLWPILLYFLQREYIEVGQTAGGMAETLRRAEYYRDLALKPGAAKEIRIWGMTDWIIGRFRASWMEAMAPVWRARRPGRPVLWGTSGVVVLLYAGTLLLLLHAALNGDVTLAALAVYVQAVMAAGQFRAFDDANMDLAFAAVSVPSLLELEERMERALAEDGRGLTATMAPLRGAATSDEVPEKGSLRTATATTRRRVATPELGGLEAGSETGLGATEGAATSGGSMRDGDAATERRVVTRDTGLIGDGGVAAERHVASPEGQPRQEIRFEGVRFRYAERGPEALSGLDLTIDAGTSLAIVGANGAGKTTLVKLLCRMYEPGEGRVLVDGINLARLDPEGWRRQVAAIFQDFTRYAMTARENVAMGAIDHARDMEKLREAAEKAGALEVIEALPSGWETVLSREYTGGVDLSGGQWQRIALARALFAVEGGARVLVLDEPTAALDVRAEAELYDRFLDLTAGLTTVLISHRFSTVRRAHRIVVLEGGRIVESGSHDDLVALGGIYARMFALQAERFVEEPVRG